jgi:hypothetical protein
MSLPKGTLTISPKLPTTLLSTIINAVKGTITLSGKLPTATATLAITAVKGTLSLIGSLPTIYLRGWKNIAKNIVSWINLNKKGAGWTYEAVDIDYEMPELYYDSFGQLINFKNQTKHTATIKNITKN